MADDSILGLCVKKKYFVWPHAESIKDGVVIYSWDYFCLKKKSVTDVFKYLQKSVRTGENV